jgi:hypothetical protein
MGDEVLIRNFFKVGAGGDRSVRQSDLGWSESVKHDAQSDYPEAIFRYVVEVLGLNVLFYWMEDRRWYTIETEKTPIEVRRIYPNPNWDGECEITKSGLEGMPHTCSKGDVLATFEDPVAIWEKLRINGVPIGRVLENSVITDLD